MRLFVCAALCIASLPAVAQEVKVGKRPGDVVGIWKDREAAETVERLSQSKVKNPEVYRALRECFVEAGTKVVVKNRGEKLSDVIVTSGPSAGCSGVFLNRQFSD